MAAYGHPFFTGGVTPGQPSGPSSFFSEFDEAMTPALDASRKAAEERYSATVGMLNQAIERQGGLSNPIPPVPVPEQANPLLASLAGFFAHLNQAQGGGGGAVAGLQNTLSSLASDRERAIATNQRAEQSFSLSQFGTTEDLHKDMLTAQRDKAAEMGDLDKAFQHNKALYALERQKAKELAETKAEAADTKAATTQRNTQENIKLRAQLREKQIRMQNKFKKEAESKAMTPAQRARMAQVNARVAELRAEMDDFRGAKDIAGESVNSPEDISDREADVHQQITEMYDAVRQEFGAGGTKAPAAPVTPPSTPSGAVSDKVKSAAERLRGSALFN